MAADARVSSSPIHIFRISAEQAETVAPLFDAYRCFYGKPSNLRAAARFLADRLSQGHSTVLAATRSTRTPATPADVIGFAQLYNSYSSIALQSICILNDLFVDRSHRRSGIARRLVSASIDHAKAGGAARIELATQHSNGPALSLYRSLGFVPETAFAQLSLTLLSDSRR